MLWNFNKDLLVYLNSFWEYSLIHSMVTFFADTPIFFLPVFLVIAWLYSAYTKNIYGKQSLLFIFYSCVLAIIIAFFVQHFIHVARPETVLKGVGHLLLKHIPDASFPSDHACVGTAFFVALILSGYKKIGYLFLLFLILMLLSRVIAGVHYPFDIIAGAMVGTFSAFFVFKILSKNKFIKIGNDFILKMLSYIKL